MSFFKDIFGRKPSGSKGKRSKGRDDTKVEEAPPAYSELIEIPKSDLARLSLYDTVFLVDDSGSMSLMASKNRTRWMQVRSFLGYRVRRPR